MKNLWVLLFVALTPWPALAQLSHEGDDCFKKANTQSDMHVCANEEAKRVDAELTRTYQHLLTVVKADPAAVAKIKKLESVWNDYRKAYIDATYPADDKQAAYGTAFPTDRDLLWAKLTHRQIESLNEIIKQSNDAK